MQTKYSAIIDIFQPCQNKDRRRPRSVVTNGDLCKTPLFAQFLRQAQILILEILNVFMWLKLSPFLNLNKN
jgi:hypothetical protein